jgi:aryl-phospho-beta-D-glucosidase BglC (GH1 family)
MEKPCRSVFPDTRRRRNFPGYGVALVYAIFAAFFLVACRSGIAKARAVSTRTAFILLPEKTSIPVSEPYRGFNLLGEFSKDWSDAGFAEEDFSLMSELGFNFARLPVDYRTYADAADWLRLKEDELRKIDEAVSWGQRYGVHVCLNLHRAPGFCINPPAEPLSLWKDAKAQDAFVAHWEFFARRYALISAEHLSFNLVNEPYGVDGPSYAAIAIRAIDAIRKIDPERPIHSDGIEGGRVPVPELIGTGVIQSYHDYAPFSVTHYRAEWVSGADRWPEPSWPITPLSPYLYGPDKHELNTPLVIEGDFEAGMKIAIRVERVSALSRIVASFDGETVFDKRFIPGPGAGEWKTVDYSEQWKIYQNIYDLECEFTAPRDAKVLRIVNTEGDWCAFSRLSFTSPGPSGRRRDITPGLEDWGNPQAIFSLGPGGLKVEKAPPGYEGKYSGDSPLGLWKDYMAEGGKAFVGEMGVYKFTPHDLSLRWLEDQLKEIKALGLGWALWNFGGPFGPLDSERADVKYEDFHGRKFDRKMIEILKRY